jgi:uncharacterized sulfatase
MAMVATAIARVHAAGFEGESGARPSLLWITCEDMSPHLGAYGERGALTPHLDRLAREGVRYRHAYAPIGVCAPARSTLITGMWPPSIGTHFMRCQGRLPESVLCFSERLRRAGYYCTNNVKTDYNFPPPKDAWDESSPRAHWRKRPDGRPFFSVFNLTATHEGQIRLGEEPWARRTAGLGANERRDPAQVALPPYHPDAPEVRRDWARYHDLITVMDREAGEILRQLEDDGLAEETIVFFFSDHGAGLPRSKRWLYDSSTRVPLIVRFPAKWRRWAPAAAGEAIDRLVTFVDFAPTALSLAGVEIPPELQGRAFLGERAAPERELVFGFRDRMDERYDLQRSVRDRRWKLIRNYLPHLPYAQHISYMFEMPTMRAWQRLHREGKLEPEQRAFFEPKPFEELYDTESDPHEIHNLAAQPKHRETLTRLRAALRAWQLEIIDLGFLPESDLRSRFGKEPEYQAARARPDRYPLARILEAAELAASGIGAVGAADAAGRLQALLGLLRESDPALRAWGAVGCEILGEPARPAASALRAALADTAPAAGIAAASALAAIDGPLTAQGLLEVRLGDASPWVRLEAINALERLGPAGLSARAAIERCLKDPNEYVRRVAEHILQAQ